MLNYKYTKNTISIVLLDFSIIYNLGGIVMESTSTELVFILDKSGSMSGLESDTIGGYNSMLEKQQKLDGACLITTVLFDNNYELLHDRIDIQAVKKLTENDYFVGGTTALYDAIGITINKIIKVQKSMPKEYQAKKVMFVIITDGEENASREYSSNKIKTMIENQQNKYAWEFVFLGANIDSVLAAKSIGISSDRAVDYIADEAGIKSNYLNIAEYISSYRKTGKIDEKYLDEIRKDTKKRKTKK